MPSYGIGMFKLGFEDFGRLLSLRYGEWDSMLHSGAENVDLGAGRRFSPEGWDECFPTIEPHGRSVVMGDLVGSAPRWHYNGSLVEQRWGVPGYEARRAFSSPVPGRLRVSFRVRANAHVEFIWASHALFSVRRLKRVVFSDGASLCDFSLDGSCSKSFRRNCGPARLEWDEGTAELSSDQPWWGIWLNRGGWPSASPAGVACLGVEAASADAETPQGASLKPGEEFYGEVLLKYTPSTGGFA